MEIISLSINVKFNLPVYTIAGSEAFLSSPDTALYVLKCGTLIIKYNSQLIPRPFNAPRWLHIVWKQRDMLMGFFHFDPKRFVLFLNRFVLGIFITSFMSTYLCFNSFTWLWQQNHLTYRSRQKSPISLCCPSCGQFIIEISIDHHTFGHQNNGFLFRFLQPILINIGHLFKKGHLAIRRVFFLIARISNIEFSHCPEVFFSLHELVVKYIRFSLVVVWQQSAAFKFVKNPLQLSQRHSK